MRAKRVGIQIVPVAQAQVTAKGIPNARLRIFERCGHNLTQEFNLALLEFLSN